MRDKKYLTFKRDEYEMMCRMAAGSTTALEDLRIIALDDAVVIRTGDIYAPAVLWSYVHAATTAIELMQNIPTDYSPEISLEIERQIGIRDYFAERAREADDRYGKLPG